MDKRHAAISAMTRNPEVIPLRRIGGYSLTVTAEIASSSLVVPAIQRLARIPPFSRRHKKAQNGYTRW